jgi:hypothetical protein
MRVAEAMVRISEMFVARPTAKKPNTTIAISIRMVACVFVIRPPILTHRRILKAVGSSKFMISSPQLEKSIKDDHDGQDRQQFWQTERAEAGMIRGRRWKHRLPPSPASYAEQVAWTENDRGDHRDDDQLRQWNKA